MRNSILAVDALMAVLVFGITVLGFGWATVGLEAAVIAVLLCLENAAAPLIQRWTRGAQGEEHVGAVLDELRGRGWFALHDVNLDKGNIDHVVVGPAGIYTIETKSHRGRISAHKIDARMLKQAYAEAKLVERITGLRAEPLLVFSSAFLTPAVTRREGVVILPARLLSKHLQDRHGAIPQARVLEVYNRLATALPGQEPCKTSQRWPGIDCDTDSVAAEPDRWSRWVLERRDAGDERQRHATLMRLAQIRDRVLDNAGPLEGATMLDVGCGDGLIGVAALDSVGARGKVIFSDVSQALLERCRETVRSRGMLDRAQFVTAAAEDLSGIPDGSVDVATMRSVLIYVEDKARAFASLCRVLGPGGRLSMFEPINRLMSPEPAGRFWGYDLSSVEPLVARVQAMAAGSQDPAYRAAMMDFDDRDLVRLAEDAGFGRIHVECHIDVEPGPIDPVVGFDALLDRAPNPNAPTVREAVATALSGPEQAQFLAALKRAFVERRAISRTAVAYVSAAKLP